MSTPIESRFEDDASGEAWFQKDVTLLEGRKQERELEEKLRRMSVMHEWQFWVGMMWVLMAFFGTDPTVRFLAIVSSVVSFAVAIDGAAAKRTQTMLEWIACLKTKDKASNTDLPPAI